MNIWKQEETKAQIHKGLRDIDISELNLSARSYNCLKRANCNTVGDVLDIMDDEGSGLRRIRNLGTRSESEIKETMETLRGQYTQRVSSDIRPGKRLVKPVKTTMSCPIDHFHLSRKALNTFRSSGIRYVQDLYREDVAPEPGWFAVRELFDQILQQ